MCVVFVFCLSRTVIYVTLAIFFDVFRPYLFRRFWSIALLLGTWRAVFFIFAICYVLKLLFSLCAVSVCAIANVAVHKEERKRLIENENRNVQRKICAIGDPMCV